MNRTRQNFHSLLAQVCVALSLLVLLVSGCQPTASEADPVDAAQQEAAIEESTPDPLTVLIIDAPELGAQIERQWQARRDGMLTLVDLTASEWSDVKFPVEADVVLYPSGFLAELVTRDCVLPVPDDVWKSEEVDRRDILKRSRQSTIEYDDQIWAMPLANPQWMLLYRADLLEQANVAVPRTWTQWDEAIDRIRKSDLPVPVEDRVVLPLAENWAAHTFLQRCAATIRQRGKLSTVFDRSSMKPLIDQAPFVEALSDLKRQAGSLDLSLTPADAWQQMLDGQLVMTIAWPTNMQSDEVENESDIAESISIAPIPGADRWFDLQAAKWFEREAADAEQSVDYFGFAGLVGSVSSESRHASSAFQFLQWLSSSPISSTVLNGSQQSGPFRKSQLKSASRWSGSQLSPAAGDSMAEQIRAAHNNPVAFVFPRVPGYSDYVRSLDKLVRECLAGKSTAAESLKSAAEEWEAITERIGRMEQTANLRRVNGL